MLPKVVTDSVGAWNTLISLAVVIGVTLAGLSFRTALFRALREGQQSYKESLESQRESNAQLRREFEEYKKQTEEEKLVYTETISVFELRINNVEFEDEMKAYLIAGQGEEIRMWDLMMNLAIPFFPYIKEVPGGEDAYNEIMKLMGDVKEHRRRTEMAIAAKKKTRDYITAYAEKTANKAGAALAAAAANATDKAAHPSAGNQKIEHY